ncbi:tetratricopeptide repeat protein [Shewanella aestuarii]|uniref:Tetratricopeptide repeat protein n=1 Tax=Shewanella aestuarii TaxID=1028752 RepID=A0A6G9QLU2_9GAMM|nr:tetratricopeptide repeat protein [Shewanella aestuarii]QIR15550.1 tetratricopeptide repeat protein [Shewanella aestuarii]
MLTIQSHWIYELAINLASIAVREAKVAVFLLSFLLLSGCQTTPETTQNLNTDALFYDELFTPVAIQSPEEIFALPQEVIIEVKQAYLKDKSIRSKNLAVHDWLAQYIGAQQGGFEYRDHYTRNAQETALSRMGNCMSLVVLSAALADVFNIPVEFQDIDVEPVWDKRGGFYLVNGHVNLLFSPVAESNTYFVRGSKVLIDFLPERAIRGYSKKTVNKQTLTAMYYNNVAAEALVSQQLDLAYALVKKSIQLDPYYVSSINTLAVIYRRKGDDKKAEQAYRAALSVDSHDVTTLFNLALILGEQDRLEEWAEVHKILELARINNPFYYYDMAQHAYFEKQYQEALVWYKRAVEKADYRHEFYFGLSRAYWATGDQTLAKKNMEKALTLTGDLNNKRRYQSKLQAMKSW